MTKSFENTQFYWEMIGKKTPDCYEKKVKEKLHSTIVALIEMCSLSGNQCKQIKSCNFNFMIK